MLKLYANCDDLLEPEALVVIFSKHGTKAKYLSKTNGKNIKLEWLNVNFRTE